MSPLTDPERLATLEERTRAVLLRVEDVEETQDTHIRLLIQNDAWKQSVSKDIEEIKTTLKRLNNLDKRLSLAVTAAAFVGPTAIRFVWEIIKTTGEHLVK